MGQVGKDDSGEEIVDHSPGYVGQTKISPRVGVGKLFVVQTKGMQDSGMEIVHMDAFFHGHAADLIRGPV